MVRLSQLKKREEKISKIRQKMALTQVASESETAF
jgi:hypothetical protein